MSLLERRLHAEWELLLALASLNPGRLSKPAACDAVFSMLLSGPAVPAAGAHEEFVTVHDIRVLYPLHFPAVPMELTLAKPVQHPNVHPEAGFVCLWERHRVSHTIEHALHKLVAMLNGTLFNADPLHVMQPAALDRMHVVLPDAFRLTGVPYAACFPEMAFPVAALHGRKPRLS